MTEKWDSVRVSREFELPVSKFDFFSQGSTAIAVILTITPP